MKKMVVLIFLISNSVFSFQVDESNFKLKPVIANLDLLNTQKNIQITKSDSNLKIGFGYIDLYQENALHYFSHKNGACGSFQSLEDIDNLDQYVINTFQNISMMNQKNELYKSLPIRPSELKWNENIQNALDQVSDKNIEDWIRWISNFPSRYNHAKEPNQHVIQLQAKLSEMIKSSSMPISIDLINHKRTQQKTLRLRIEGAKRPNEIIVIGAHYDSINIWDTFGDAPGADDNASGSANILEALRLILKSERPERTLEFFWYAGEESGLLGSTEIADQYKKENKNVIAVLQLDMTLFPGSGRFKVGNVTDFTSAWLREYFKSMNETYLKVQLVDDRCGYACSDHASWYRNGYSTLLPFEATTQTMNSNIHTTDDIFDQKSDVKHSTVFAKIALVFALDLANSNLSSPL